jgi:hypothetical protein
MRRIEQLAGLAALCFVAGPALAHTPYLKPTTFAPDRPFVSVEAAMTEGNFFTPDFPIRSEGAYWVTGPSGEASEVKAVTTLKEFAVVEAALPTDGTYRISTGERSGRSTRWVKIDGAWKIVRPAGAPARERMGGGEEGEHRGPPAGAPRGEGGRFVEESAVPAGAETLTSRSYSRSDTYVTRGAPDRGALKPTGKGLEVEPITHPNEVFVGEAFKFRLLNDGAPMPGAAFSIARAGDAYAETRYAYNGKSDAAGAAAVTFDQPGAYVLQVSYPPRIEGEPAPGSRNYTLTFEVTR